MVRSQGLFRRLRWVLPAILGACALAVTARPAHASLYDELGSAPGVTRLVDDFVNQVAADHRMNGFFANPNLPRVKAIVAEQLAAATGGPGVYNGPALMETYKGSMMMTEAAFNSMEADFVGALINAGVPFHTQNQVLAIIAPFAHQVATK